MLPPDSSFWGPPLFPPFGFGVNDPERTGVERRGKKVSQERECKQTSTESDKRREGEQWGVDTLRPTFVLKFSDFNTRQGSHFKTGVNHRYQAWHQGRVRESYVDTGCASTSVGEYIPR